MGKKLSRLQKVIEVVLIIGEQREQGNGKRYEECSPIRIPNSGIFSADMAWFLYKLS